MKPTIPYIQQKFDEYNQLCFGGELPQIPIRLSNAKTFLGQFRYKRRRKLLFGVENFDLELVISTRIDLPEAEVEDTIIHEMIHYYILHKQIRDTSSHGHYFRQLMADINHRFGRHITITHHSTPEQRQQLIGTQRKLHLICLIQMTDGQYCIKAVPRVKERIMQYHKSLNDSPNIRTFKWYFSYDPWFNQFPVSTGSRMQTVKADEVELHLTDAKPLLCDGKTLKYEK